MVNPMIRFLCEPESTPRHRHAEQTGETYSSASGSAQLYVGRGTHSRTPFAELNENGGILQFAARLLRLGCMQWNSENGRSQQSRRVEKGFQPLWGPRHPATSALRELRGAFAQSGITGQPFLKLSTFLFEGWHDPP